MAAALGAGCAGDDGVTFGPSVESEDGQFRFECIPDEVGAVCAVSALEPGVYTFAWTVTGSLALDDARDDVPIRAITCTAIDGAGDVTVSVTAADGSRDGATQAIRCPSPPEIPRTDKAL